MAIRPGVVVKIGGVEYQAPPLNITGLVTIEESGAMALRNSSKMRDKVQGCLVIAVASLNRNYPDMTVEQLTEETEAQELAPLMKAVAKLLDISGFVPAGSKATGEAKAGESSTTSN